jgi:cation transport ATPase
MNNTKKIAPDEGRGSGGEEELEEDLLEVEDGAVFDEDTNVDEDNFKDVEQQQQQQHRQGQEGYDQENEKKNDDDDNGHDDEEDAQQSQSPKQQRCQCHWTLSRLLIIALHVVFVALTVICENVFLYTWSDKSQGSVWIASTNHSVIQHLKMMFWPWLLILWPMDLLSKYWYSRRYKNNENGTTTTTTSPPPAYFYISKINNATWLSLCMSQLVAMATTMIFVSVVWSIFYYSGLESNPADVALFMIGLIPGIVLRLYIMTYPVTVSWWMFVYMLLGMIWIFTYFSYSDNAYEGYWFDPDPYNVTST